MYQRKGTYRINMIFYNRYDVPVIEYQKNQIGSECELLAPLATGEPNKHYVLLVLWEIGT